MNITVEPARGGQDLGAIAIFRSLGFEAVTPCRDNPVPGALSFGESLRA